MYSGLVLATAFSGLIAAGVFSGLEGARSLAGWQWLFILEGASSFLFAVVSMWILPDFSESDSGSTKWFFLERASEKLALDRIIRDCVSAPTEDESIMHGLKLCSYGLQNLGLRKSTQLSNEALYNLVCTL